MQFEDLDNYIETDFETIYLEGCYGFRRPGKDPYRNEFWNECLVLFFSNKWV